MNYWKECIEEAFDDAGIPATDQQIETVTSWIAGAHENYGMAFGHDAIPNPTEIENKKIKEELKIEKQKIFCELCEGKGIIVSHGPCHSGTSTCDQCKGEGRYTP